MMKAYSLFLIVFLCFFLCGCFNSSDSKIVTESSQILVVTPNNLEPNPTSPEIKEDDIDVEDTTLKYQSEYPLKFDQGGSVVDLAISPDGNILASIGGDNIVKLWNPQTDTEVGEINVPVLNDGYWGITSIEFSPDGSILAGGATDGSIIFWDPKTGKQIGTLDTGHDGFVDHLVFGREKNVMISGSRFDTIILWDYVRGEKLGIANLPSSISEIKDIFVHPKENVLIVSGWGGTISGRIWFLDEKTFKVIDSRSVDRNYNSIAVSPDGSLLVTGGDQITVWDGNTNTPSRDASLGEPLSYNNDEINTISFSPNGSFFVSGDEEGDIRFYDFKTRHQVGQLLQDQRLGINSLLFSPDGSLLISGAGDGTIFIWKISDLDIFTEPAVDTETATTLNKGEFIHLLIGSVSVSSLAFTPINGVLATGSCLPKENVSLNSCAQRVFHFWDPNNRTEINKPILGTSLFAHGGVNKDYLDYNLDGSLLAGLNSSDGIIRVWDVDSGELKYEFKQDFPEMYIFSKLNLESNILYGGTKNGKLLSWDLENGQIIDELTTDYFPYVYAMAVNSDEKLLAIAGCSEKYRSSDLWECKKSEIAIWDIRSGQQIGYPLTGHNEPILSLVFNVSGEMIVSGGYDNRIYFWDLIKQQPIGAPIEVHAGDISTMAISPDGRTLATGSSDSTIILWDFETRNQMGEPLIGHSSGILCLAFSPSGDILASGSCVVNPDSDFHFCYQGEIGLWHLIP